MDITIIFYIIGIYCCIKIYNKLTKVEQITTQNVELKKTINIQKQMQNVTENFTPGDLDSNLDRLSAKPKNK